MKSWSRVWLVMWAVKTAKVFCGASARGLAVPALAASCACLVGPGVGGAGGRVDGCDALQGLTGGIKIVQAPWRGGARRRPGRPRSSCPSPVSPAGRPVVRAGPLGVLVSLDRVGPHLLGRQARYPEERPARLRPVHGQPCPPLPPGEGRVRLVSASWPARTSSRAPGLPALLEQIVDLAPGLGHPPGGAPLLSRRPPDGSGSLRLMPDRAHEQQVRRSRTCTGHRT